MKTGIKSQIVIVSAVAAVLLIVMSGCAIAESITFEKVAVLAASVLALNKCCGILFANAITILHGFGIKTKTGALLQRAMLFPKTGSGAVIPGSFSQWHAPFACGKPPSSVLPISAWF